MFSVDDIRTPRDRVSEEYIRRLLEGEERIPNPECTCRGCEESEAKGSMQTAPVMLRKTHSCGCRSDVQKRVDAHCDKESMHRCRMLEEQSLAMVFSPCQLWRGIYAPDMALQRGTLFKELDKPWGVENRKGGCGCGK